VAGDDGGGFILGTISNALTFGACGSKRATLRIKRMAGCCTISSLEWCGHDGSARGVRRS
jgi:hypothetical protein